ncbi:MAG TPA: helix-turn-helix transcriptional regulator [Streptomyces sp.]
MAQWEPLADRIPVDVRRLATQLRRMKDRSGLTVPALAARTSQPAEAWERYLNGRHLPPLDAVEVLAQASGADYERLGALWRLAEKATSGSGDRGRGKPVPYPDPLDPLSAEEGLPRRRRRALLLITCGVLAVGALLAVLLAAVPSNGRSPERDAGATQTPRAATSMPRGASPSARAVTAGQGGGSDRGTPADGPTGGDATPAPDGHTTPLPGGGPSPSATRPGPGPGGSSAPGAPGAPTIPGSGTPTTTAGGGSGNVPPPSSPASPTSNGICLSVLILGVCLGGSHH